MEEWGNEPHCEGRLMVFNKVTPLRLFICMTVGLLAATAWLISARSSAAPARSGQLSALSSSAEESLRQSPFVVGDIATDEQQVLAAAQAKHASPEAFIARLRSRTQFAHLDAAAAARAVNRAFPNLINQRDGGVPTLPQGDTIRRYSAPNVVQLSIPGHKRAIIESLGPLAKRTASGKLVPINLALENKGSSFQPAAPEVAVQIPKQLPGGVRAPASGVSLTPTDARGEPLRGSEGLLQGASVLYANTQTDTDTLAKPTSSGFEMSSILRSQASPHELYYRLGLPHGARLIQHEHGPAQIVSNGVTLGIVTPPSAVDAEGTTVPVTMSIDHDTLSVAVQDKPGEYQYPIEVDPEYYTAEDRSLTGGVFPVEEYKGGTNWKPFYSGGFTEEHTYKKSYSCGGSDWYWCEQSWYIEPNREYNAGEFAGLQYKTQGESTIYNLEMWVEGENEPSQTTTQVEYNYGPNGEGQDNHVVLSGGEKQERYKYEPLSMTSGYLHNPLETPRNNDVRIMDYTTKHESLYGFWTWIWAARVYVAQEESKHPETEPTSTCPQCGFNTTSPTISGRTNVLYGSGSWLSPSQGAYEVTAHDPGIGISYVALTGEGDGYHPRWIRNEEGKCLGIQCAETYSSPETYNSTMPSGERSVELFAENAAEMYGYSYHTIKIDATPPEAIGFSGMPEEGAEITAAPRTLTIHATDGKAPTASSGVKSVEVSLDGAPETAISASCSPGPCTASGTYSLGAEALSEGVHSLTITAADNAGNVASKEFFFDVRHASPISVGPGAVDPTTGQFTLTASDVSLGSASGVERSYESRNLTAGTTGPLGPQWAMSVGGGEGLGVLPSGNVLLISGTGGVTTFTLNKKGELEAPKGDENLKIENKASEHKYILKDATAGSETVFEQPAGTQSTPPIYGASFGAEASVLSRPVSDALDSSGDVWVTDWTDNRIAEFSKTGTLIATYGSEGTEGGQFRSPFGIAVNQSTGNVYVTDYSNSRIEELSSSGAFIRAMGWGVSNGNAEYENCTSSCKAGIAGSGAGQLSGPDGISVDSSGNVWVAEEGNDRVQEFSEAGAYLGAFGSAGKGSGQLEAPMDIAFAAGNIYVSDQNNNRVDEFSTAGSFVKAIGWGVANGESKLETCTTSCQAGIAGSGNGQFNAPRGLTTDPVSGNLYVTDLNNNRVQEISTSGTFIAKFGSGGSGAGQFSAPMGAVVSSTGTIYVTDFYNSRIQEWGRVLWRPTSAKGSLPAHATYTYAPVENSEGTTTMQPYEVVSPPPAGVTCGTKIEELKDGCRALTFKYATETTAKGESESEWGEYKGQLSQVIFHAYNPTAKAMEEKPVAQYSYDKQGRLRAEWDPRISPALKTTYGYDTEGHLTSLTPPGQESWAFLYGTIASDPNPGRLMKATLAPSSAKLWGGELTANTEAPKLSGTPTVGVRMSASNGTWSNSPIAYAYQWEDCNTSGGECKAIVGADNANYTPVSGDLGHTLVVQVRATNGGGTAMASSAASATVVAKGGSYKQTIDGANSLNAVSCVPSTTECVVTDGAGKAMYSTNVSATASASWTSWTEPKSPSEAVACPSSTVCTLADGDVEEGVGGNLYYASALGGTWKEAFAPAYGVLAISCGSPTMCVDGQEGGGFIHYSTKPASTQWISLSIGSGAMNAVDCISSSFCAVADSTGHVHVANSEGNIKNSTGWKSTDVEGSTSLNGIACASTTSCIAIDDSGNILNLTINGSGEATATKQDIDGSNHLTAVSCVAASICAAVDTSGNVFVSKNAGATWAKEFSFGDKLTSVSCPSASLCLATDTTGSTASFTPGATTITEGEVRAPQPGSTIEYRVPVSGEGAPHNLSKEEVEKWGQKDKSELENNDPSEATAIFPPDEPQTWPASSYKRAVIGYVNEKGLRVNTATPTGAIYTSEYNSLNELTRTLSADNRAAALKEGCESLKEHKCKSEEAAEKLDTKTEYSPEGTQIVKVTGPEHTVKLPTGEELKARPVTHDYYNEGAKEAEEKNKETYDLLTKTTEAALLGSGKEALQRETLTSYSGQEDLGWKLRKPTSVTKDPGGLALTTTTAYENETGNITETRTPASSGTSALLSAGLKFGSYGSKEGQFEAAEGVAIDPSSGDVYVVDRELSRVEKFSSSGTFLGWVGSEKSGSGEGQLSHPESIAVSSTGNVYVGDAGNHRIEEFNAEAKYVRAFGKEGTGEGQFGNALYGMAFDGNGKLWVTDGANHRIETFSEAGVFEKQYGEKGTGEGQFEEPRGITVAGGDVYVVDTVNARVVELTLEGKYVSQFGKYGLEDGQLREPWGIAADAKGDLYVADRWPDRVEEFSAKGQFIAWIGSSGTSEGQFEDPDGLAVSTAGDLYVADQGNDRVDEWLPGNASAHDTRTVYYSATANSEFKTCGEHPEWAGLVCKTVPKAQPGTKGLPELPEVTIAAYNIWDDDEKREEKFASTLRTSTETYDAAGRALTSEETTSPATDQALPKTTIEYNKETGAVEKQSATIKGETKTITSKYNKLGELSEYTDAEGNLAKYTYEEGGDGRLVEESEGKGTEAESKQTYSYNATTGDMEKLVDSAAGTFTASYDLEGKLVSEIYPNGMCANTTYNSVGEAVGLEYIKTRNCSESKPTVWFSDSIVPAIYGETVEQVSTLSKENYAYDNVGRLLESQETPSGKGCTVHLYAYDEEGNRTSLTQREPATGGGCAGEGGATEHGKVEPHGYDMGNRLTDSGVEYEMFGNTTKLPAADAGGHELTGSYYVDNQVYTQKQNGETLTYDYDPAGRTMEMVSEGKVAAKLISHYAGPGGTPTWTSEGSGKWTRSIPGINGSLSATQKSGETPVLELQDLAGDIVATAALSESETKLLSTYNSTEFGVPQPGTTPPKYAWLGAGGLATEAPLESGVATKGGASYIPQIARTLQTAPVIAPGAFPDGQPGTQYSATVSPTELKAAEEEATRIWQRTEAERQRTKEREAAEALQKCQEEGGCGAPGGPGAEAEGGSGEEAELYDPEGLASYKRTMQRAGQLRQDATNGFLIGLAVDVVVDGAAETGAEYASQLNDSAHNLEQCVAHGKSVGGQFGRWGACYINEWRVEVWFVSIPWYAVAEFCGYIGEKQWGKKSHALYECQKSQVVVWGPWF
jgi:DNA-binding beta-propeller fold protein YncE